MNTNEQISKNPFGRLLNSQTAIDFYGRRMVGFVAAIVILVITVVSLFAQGLNLGLDFEGGNAWDVPASDTFDIDEAEQVLQDQGIDTAGARIQRRTSESADVVTVQIEEVPSEKSAEITAALADAAGVDTSAVSVAFTSSTWGAEITEKAVRALIVFFIVVSLFISVRFEWRMAVAAFAAMVHDVIAVVGVYSVFQFEVSPATVVAFLTILGYSLYDTIVVFDRVKENQAKFSSRAHAVPGHREHLDEPGVDALAEHEHRLHPAGVVPLGDRLGPARRRGARGVRAGAVHRHGRRRVLVDLHRHAAARVDAPGPQRQGAPRAAHRRGAPRRRRRLECDGPRRDATCTPRSATNERRWIRIVRGRSVQPGSTTTPRTERGATPEQMLTHPPRPRKKKRH